MLLFLLHCLFLALRDGPDRLLRPALLKPFEELLEASSTNFCMDSCPGLTRGAVLGRTVLSHQPLVM